MKDAANLLNEVRRLEAENRRAAQENDRLWTEVRRLKSERDRRWNNYLFSNESRELGRRVVDTLARLEEDADPQTALATDSIVTTGGGDPSPIPGSRTEADRRRLQRFQRRLRGLLDSQEREWDNQAQGVKPVRVKRPTCLVCGQRGQAGWAVCPRGCGPYEGGQ